VAKFKCFGMMVTNQNCIHDEINSRLNLDNACYHAVQNLLYSQLLPRNVKIKIYKTIILPVVLYECENWSFTLIVLVEESAEENVWTLEEGGNKRLEKIA
jgi:hypothetical protein